MFKLVPEPTFKAAVAIPTVNGSGSITLTMKYRNREEVVSFMESFTATPDTPRRDEDVVADVVVGWEGVDAEFNAENLALLLKFYPGAASAIVDDYLKRSTRIREKN